MLTAEEDECWILLSFFGPIGKLQFISFATELFYRETEVKPVKVE